MDKKFNCPQCNSRHTSEAWTYKTRYELGITNIDKEDIIPISESERLKYSKNFFICPTCGGNSSAVHIFEFNKTLEQFEEELCALLTQLKRTGGSILGIKGIRTDKISVDYLVEENSFDVRYTDDLLGSVIESTGDVSETIDFLLWLGVSNISLMGRKTKTKTNSYNESRKC